MDSNLSNVLKFLFPAVVYIYLQSASASPTFGPFAARVKEVSHCENVQTEDLVRFDGRSTKINKTSYAFTGNVTYKIPITSDINLQLHFARYGNGGWKDNYMILDLPDACVSMKSYIPKVFEVFMKSIGKKACPVQPGVFEVCDFPLNYFTPDSSKVPSFQYGLYRVDFSFITGGRNIGCQSFIVEIVPLKRTG